MEKEDLPATFRAAEDASASAQALHFRLLRGHLLLLVSVAFLSVWAPAAQAWSTEFGVAAAILMVGAIVFGIGMRVAPVRDRWFACRAVAENAKGLAWRFAMGVLGRPDDGRGAEADFVESLRAVEQRFPDAAPGLSQFLVLGAPEISPRMSALRSLSVPERVQVFSEQRIADQVNWYGRKARWNQKRERLWWNLVLTLEGLAVVFVILRISKPEWVDLAGVMAAGASALIAWTQARRYAELGSTYFVAHQDLKALQLTVPHVTTLEGLAALVDDVEGAVSREHGMWLTRSGARGIQL